ncbi:hypothetical protein [Bdellovibrio sp. NC01]|uniref:hypothetical protein n=1 Tax=Bdellovibrio sp. NC01 TaxID=2220073 RepID=UPI00115BFE0F|nr:hypothetical protein [Bdellovibrio sp. NC01]QDK37653.1 hypothetical protein DOE51_08700 [Bdellovibrio sp. NC01]
MRLQIALMLIVSMTAAAQAGTTPAANKPESEKPKVESKLKTVSDFYAESSDLFKKAQSDKDKTEKLLALEKSFKKTLDEYEKALPKEGNKAEEEVSLLFYTLEPVFKLAKDKKIEPDKCSRTRQEIKTSDSMGKSEGAPTGTPALEAYKWLNLICPEVIDEE